VSASRHTILPTADPIYRRAQGMSLLASVAVTKDIGLIATFIGIGVIVNIIIVYIAVQVSGERHQNRLRKDEQLR
jgi:hypothetical protein